MSVERLPPILLPRGPGEVHIRGREGRHPAGEGGAPPAPHPHRGVGGPHTPRGIWGRGGVGLGVRNSRKSWMKSSVDKAIEI